MSTTWGRLFGNTATFALRLELMDDPDHGAGATPFESASWGAFEIHVNGRNLCTHYDGGALSGAVNWYLSPLASWFRAEWTPLLHEERLPVPAIDGLMSIAATGPSDAEQEAMSDWWTRHHLWAAADGGLFPELTLRRLGDDIEFAWGDGSAQPGRPDGYRFVESGGRDVVPIGPVAEVLGSAFCALTDEVARRVPVAAAGSLRDAWTDLGSQDLRSDSIRWSVGKQLWEQPRVASSLTKRERERHALLTRRAPLVALFASASPTLDEHDVEQLLDAVNGDRLPEDVRLRAISRPITEVDPRWERTRAIAWSVAEEFSSWAGPPFQIEGLIGELGIVVRDVSLHDPGIGAVSLADGVGAPVIAINTAYRNRSDRTRRFDLAHEFGHLLMDRNDARELGITSGPWGPYRVEQRARAFAAALLIGFDPLNEAVRYEALLDGDAISRLTERFAVPWTAMLGQLRFDGHLTWAEHDTLLGDAKS